MAVLPNLNNETDAALRAIIAKQTEQLAAMQAALEAASKPKALTMKVSEKGALSIYGLGRFPVTLYRTQWERLFNARQQIIDFIKTNHTLLATKD